MLLPVRRHIILAVRDSSSRWGALGLSREEGLQWKLLSSSSLGALLSDYRDAYGGCGHEIMKVRIGLPMPHDNDYRGKVSAPSPGLLVWRAMQHVTCCTCGTRRVGK